MALLTSLVSYWKLEEASGLRADSHGLNPLTDVNTVTGNPGKILNAAQFTALNSEQLTHTSNASLQTGDVSFTLAAWVYLDSAPADAVMIVCKADDGTPAVSEYWLEYYPPTTRFRFNLEESGGATEQAIVFGEALLATWYYVVAWYDSVADTLNLSVNDGGVGTTATVTAPAATAGLFRVGSWGTSRFWDGRIDEVAFWKRTLSAGERTQLYNGGAGLAYPFGETPGSSSAVPSSFHIANRIGL